MIALLLAAAATAVPPSGSWPGFRGTGDGVSPSKALPVEWSEKTGVAWATDLPGYGQSAPVVVDGTVYATAVSGKNREVGYVVAVDAATGKEKWRHTFEPTQKAEWSYTVSRAAPTPCADADGVYAFFEGGNLIALTPAGTVRWERSLVKDYGEFQGNHGIGGSPAQTADTLFVLVDHGGPSYLVAVDKATGKTKWKTDRAGKTSWTSPVVASQGGRPVVVASSNGSVTAYAADTGAEAWKLDGVVGNTLPSASVSDGVVLVGAGSPRGTTPPKDARSNCCLALTADGGKPGYEVRWAAKPGLANYATPVAAGGVAYFVNQVGVVTGFDLASGKELFAERTDGPCWASPIVAGGHVYFFGKNGTTTVVKAGPSFEVVSVNRLWPATAPKPTAPNPAAAEGRGNLDDSERVLYGAAAADGALFLRSGTTLYRVGKP